MGTPRDKLRPIASGSQREEEYRPSIRAADENFQQGEKTREENKIKRECFLQIGAWKRESRIFVYKRWVTHLGKKKKGGGGGGRGKVKVKIKASVMIGKKCENSFWKEEIREKTWVISK